MREASRELMRVIDKREYPDLAVLYLAQVGSDPELLAEFVDTREPGVPASEKWVMMISTQFGCPVGCRMCDAGAMAYRGNLSAAEILGQVRLIVKDNPGRDIGRHPKVKIHFARMGEPSLNPAVLEALRLLAREFPGAGILPSLSTVAPGSPAIAPFFEELIDIKNSLYPGGRFQLQFSLHSMDEGKRRQIVPIRKWALEEIAEYGNRYFRPGDRKITLNFALAQGEAVDCGRLAAVFSNDKFFVKITPINPTATAEKNGATHLWVDAPGPIRACADALKARGYETLISPSLPEEIAAETSCGQLWSRAMKSRAAVTLKNRGREAGSYASAGSLPARAAVWKREIEKFERRRFPLHPDKAGLLVVDYQELFLSPAGPAYLPAARAVFGNVARLVSAFRQARRPVYFTVHAHQDPARDGGLMTRWWKSVCLAGSPEARVSALLEPDKARVFQKCRYSAFTNPSLARVLRSDGVEELVVAGLATNLCVESSVRSGFDLGIQMTVVLDATAAHAEDLHLGAIKNMAFGFATILDADSVVNTLRTAFSGAA